MTDDKVGPDLGEHGVHDAYFGEQDPHVLHVALIGSGGMLVSQPTAVGPQLGAAGETSQHAQGMGVKRPVGEGAARAMRIQ